MADAARVVVLLSGNGSNLQAIADYTQAGSAFDVVGVISDRADAYGLERARVHDIPAIACERGIGTRAEHEQIITQHLERLQPDILVLAGYMRILSGEFVRAWYGRMLNVHPSLLPKYRGLDTHARAIADDEPFHGASVHFVTEQLDGGPLITQHSIAIAAGETAQSLRAKVQSIEYQIYPRTIDALSRGDLRLQDDQVMWRNAPLEAVLTLDELTQEHA